MNKNSVSFLQMVQLLINKVGDKNENNSLSKI